MYAMIDPSTASLPSRHCMHPFVFQAPPPPPRVPASTPLRPPYRAHVHAPSPASDPSSSLDHVFQKSARFCFLRTFFELTGFPCASSCLCAGVQRALLRSHALAVVLSGSAVAARIERAASRWDSAH